MTVVYLAGPINGCTDAEANDWRTAAKELLTRHDAEWLDPMRRDYRGREDEAVAEIVEGDKADIDACDVVIASCPRPSYGTAMEILYAWEVGKPVVVMHPEGSAVSPWLRYHSVAVVGSVSGAVDAVLREPVDRASA